MSVQAKNLMWIYSRTPLFRTRLIRSPRFFEQRSNFLGFTFMFSVIYYQLFRIPRYFERIVRSFPTPSVNQPRYFELVKNRVQEQTPKRPTKQSRLSHAAVCLLLREPRFDGKQASCQ